MELLLLIILVLVCVYVSLATVYRPWIGVWILFLGAAFYPLLNRILPMPKFGASGFVFIDFVVLSVLVGLIVKKENILNLHEVPKYLYWLWLLFVPPFIIGLVRGHNIFTVFRDARVLIYYGIIFPLYTLFITDKMKLQRFLRYVMFFSVAALIVYYVMAAFDIRFHIESGALDFEGIAHYTWWGLSSWFVLYLLSALYLIPRLITKQENHTDLFVVVCFMLIITLITLLIRSLFIGLIISILYLILVLSIYLKERKILFIASFIVVIFIFILVNLSYNQITRSPILSRYGSLISPVLKYSAAEASTKIRIDALLLFKQNEGIFRIIGSGYGDENLAYDYLRDYHTIRLMNHRCECFLFSKV